MLKIKDIDDQVIFIITDDGDIEVKIKDDEEEKSNDDDEQEEKAKERR